jgi:hypothetical protein
LDLCLSITDDAKALTDLLSGPPWPDCVELFNTLRDAKGLDGLETYVAVSACDLERALTKLRAQATVMP